MPETTPSPRKPRRWLRWTLIVFAVIGFAVFLLFRDVALEPADDLMPKRPAIAWDDNNGWKKMEEFAVRHPVADKELTRWISAVAELKEEPEKEKLHSLVLVDDEISELEEITKLPHFQDRTYESILAMPQDLAAAFFPVFYRLHATFLEAMEENLFPGMLRAVRLGSTLQAKHFHGSTSSIDFLVAFIWLPDDLVARALVRMDLRETELAELAQLLERDPFTAENTRELVRQEFRQSRNLLLMAAGPLPDETAGLRRYFFQRNRTLNLLASEARLDLSLTMDTPYEAVQERDRQRENRLHSLGWYSPNIVGEQFIVSQIAGPGETTFRSRVAVHRCLRVVIALHRFHQAHGKLPATLDELVPAFLSSVPLDPFDLQPLRWDQSGKVVFSIGSDGKVQTPKFENAQSRTGWLNLTTAAGNAPGARFRTKADGPDSAPNPAPLRPR